MGLTDTTVRHARPKERPYKLYDSRGLYLVVAPTGGKLWRGKYRWEGKERTLSLGSYPTHSLARARANWDAAREIKRAGIDPNTAKKLTGVTGYLAGRPTTAPSLETIARDWYQQNLARWKPHHAAKVLANLERDVFPLVGGIAPDNLTAPVLLAALRQVEARGSVDTAHRLRAYAERICGFGISAGLCTTNPAAALRGALTHFRNGNLPAKTTVVGARAVLAACEAIPAFPTSKLGLRLLAITAVRPGELRGLVWPELEALNSPAPLWRIPAERMKKGEQEHLVPLSRQAVEIIETLRTLTGQCKYAIPSSRDSEKPASENCFGCLLKRAGFQGEHVPHGFRSSFSTVANETFPEDADAIEAALAHTPKDRVRSAYNRGCYLMRRRDLLQWWADRLLDGLPPPQDLLIGKRR